MKRLWNEMSGNDSAFMAFDVLVLDLFNTYSLWRWFLGCFLIVKSLVIFLSLYLVVMFVWNPLVYLLIFLGPGWSSSSIFLLMCCKKEKCHIVKFKNSTVVNHCWITFFLCYQTRSVQIFPFMPTGFYSLDLMLFSKCAPFCNYFLIVSLFPLYLVLFVSFYGKWVLHKCFVCFLQYMHLYIL